MPFSQLLLFILAICRKNSTMIKIFLRKPAKFPSKQNSLLYKIELQQKQAQKGVLKAISAQASTTYQGKMTSSNDK